MGACCSDGDAARQDREVKEKLLARQRSQNVIKKLLLLGAGGSGKSTFFKQLQNIHGKGFSDKERMSFRNHICHQIIEQMKRLIGRAEEYLILDYPMSEEGQWASQQFEIVKEDAIVTDRERELIEILWNEECIKRTFEMRARFGIFDSSAFFFENIRRVSSPQYIPTEQDVLRVRHRTTGVVDKLFTINGKTIRICDVGGQRAERKKWIHCFEGVTAVLFVASLSGYDEVMYEEESENVMHDSLQLFSDICNNAYFVDTPMLLFLNKSDLFKQKLKDGIALSVCFPDFSGDTSDVLGCLNFIQAQFNAQNHQVQRKIYNHVTCAMDEGNVKKVFNDVQHIIIEDQLDQGGLL